MHVSLLTSFVALAIFAAAAPQPGQRDGRTIPIAKRSGFLDSKRSLNIDALTAHRASVENKILHGLANFEQNTKQIDPSVAHKPEKRGAGEPLTDSNDALWYGTISVGTPPKPFTVQIDTGSSDLFLPGSKCNSSCNGHTLWNPSSSSTSKDTGNVFQLPYGDKLDPASVVVEEYTDTVSIAGLTATNQALGAATSYSSGFNISQFPADGLIGMAFQSISTFNSSPVFQTLISEKQVSEPVFSFKLSSSGSELYLGGTNSKLYTGAFTYVPLTEQSYWRVKMDNIQGNGKTLLSNVDSIIDTGTSLVLGVPSQVSALHSALGGKPVPSGFPPGFYTFPCSSIPSVSFSFGGKSFAIPASTFNLGQISDNSTDCVSGIAEHAANVPFWVIGDLFLRGVYSTFDVGNLRVGFASLA